MVFAVGLCPLAVAAAAAADDIAAPPPSATTSTKPPSPPTPSISIDVDSDDAADSKSEPATPAKRSRHAKAHIQLGDREFDSFAEAMQTAPWIVGLLFMILGTLFLTPVILLVGIIWYKLRKTRLQNDAMLKLAERGVMPPAQAASTLVSGAEPSLPPDAPHGAATTESGFAQVVAARRRAVWSDLRKGVIVTAVGLSFVFYSMLESGEANWLGLLLMFVGLGYLVLWWLEDRHLQERNASQSSGRGTGPT